MFIDHIADHGKHSPSSPLVVEVEGPQCPNDEPLGGPACLVQRQHASFLPLPAWVGGCPTRRLPGRKPPRRSAGTPSEGRPSCLALSCHAELFPPWWGWGPF